MTLIRPKSAPRKIPLWAWHHNAWINGGRKGPRPADSPKRIPAWFWLWRSWGLKRAKSAHGKHIRQHPPQPTMRQEIVKHAKWGAEPAISPKIHYTQDSRRDDWLMLGHPNMIPQWTDCSGWDTQCDYSAVVDGHRAPDPNGLNYKYLGYTGTLLEHAYKYGKVITVHNGDASAAKAGDCIVIGPGTGEHVVKVIAPGRDPMVSSHGSEGVHIQHLSVDNREPKRICQILP